MPSVTYMNQSAPFWDFIAGLEAEGANHPFFSQWSQNQNNDNAESAEGDPHGHHGHPSQPPFGPWGWGFPGFGGGRGLPHRGPPPPGPPPPFEDREGEKDGEKEKDDDNNNNNNGEGPSGSGSETEGCPRGKGRHGRCGGRRGPHGWGRGGFGPHHGPPPHHGCHGRRGRWGPWAGRGGPFGGPFGGHPFNPLAFAAGLFDPSSTNKKDNEDFSPEADVFDTPTSFVIHVSLPGAKKEDVGVNWDVEKSELSIAGVIYRPGDEDFLKTLAMDERKVGPFERKVRLGTRANPAIVDADGISAKLEDGVLRVEVPKLGDGGFVEVRKVDIE